MDIRTLDIKGLALLTPRVFGDARGYFFESYNERLFRAKLPHINFVQDNESRSTRGTLRGLHYQLPPAAQSKLVRVVYGKVLDVAVDVRRHSPSFGKLFSVELSEENKLQFFVPRGFAHGFVALSSEAVFQYKVDNEYSKENERGIRFDDPSLAIDWRIGKKDLILSEKDLILPLLKDADLFDAGDGDVI